MISQRSIEGGAHQLLRGGAAAQRESGVRFVWPARRLVSTAPSSSHQGRARFAAPSGTSEVCGSLKPVLRVSMLFVLLLLVAACTGAVMTSKDGAVLQKVVLIRHGEKNGTDDLSPRGFQRAECLATHFADYGITCTRTPTKSRGARCRRSHRSRTPLACLSTRA